MKIEPLFGPYGSAAVEHIHNFARLGANALWFHMFDAAAFDACARYNIAACVEFKTFRADFHQRPELVPIGADGSPIRYGELVQGVCLSQVEFLEETEAALVDGIGKFQPAGIWLDYLTYAGWFETPEPDLQEACFCPHCIADFCDTTGLDAETPAQILSKHPQAWQQHKCARVAKYALRYAALIRQKHPGCVVGAYMCPWRPDEYGGALRRIFAQDYDLLAPAIDVFTPLIYCTKSGRSTEWGREFLEASHTFIPEGKAVQLILDVLEYPASLQAAAESAVPSLGVQVYGGAKIFGNAQMEAAFVSAVEKIRLKTG